MSNLSTVTVEQFFEREKTEAREWLLGSLDMLFTRMNNKFIECFNVQPLNDQQLVMLNPGADSAQSQLQQQNQLLEPQAFINTNEILNQTIHYPDNAAQFIFRDDLSTNVQIKKEIHETVTSLSVPSTDSMYDGLNPNLPEVVDDPEYDDVEEEDEDECDCDDCLNGGIDGFKEEDEIEDEIVIEDDQDDQDDQNITKRQRIDDQLVQHQSNFNQMHIQNIQVITLALKCHQPHCPRMFSSPEKLNLHMFHAHCIRPFVCLLRGCSQSFDDQSNLDHHLTHAHSNIQSNNNYQCGSCSGHFMTYDLLCVHHSKHHHLGRFQCPFPECSFVGEYRLRVRHHYYRQHPQQLICRHPGCGHRFKHNTNLKAHERAHLNIKPYRCRWPGCQYAATQRSNAIGHIRRNHLNRRNSNPNQTDDDPRKYVEVVHELLQIHHVLK